jgi:hypothetical protein
LQENNDIEGSQVPNFKFVLREAKNDTLDKVRRSEERKGLSFGGKPSKNIEG